MSIRNKIRFSIANRLSLVFFSVFIMAVGIIYFYVVPQLQNQLTDRKRESLVNYSSLFSESFYAAINQGASPVYQQLLTQQYAEKADARILVINGSGFLVADSLKGQSFEAGDYEQVATDAMVEKTPVSSTRKLGDKNYMLAAAPLGSPGKSSGVIVVASSMSDVESAVSLVRRQLSIAAMAALVIALIAIYLASHILARRIQRIEKGAMLIAQGNFDTRVPVVSQDELGQLAKAFNEMGDRLGSAFKQIDFEKRRAQLLLDDLSEGVLGIDTGGNVIVANPAAERLLGVQINPPAPLMGFVPEEVYLLWDSMKPESPVREDTFLLEGEKALQVHSSFLSDQEELKSLLVLRDVSQEVKLERSRRDFIANASHELKTPLFSLGGFLEILQGEDVDEETQREFINTMKEQVDRLAELARNLLDLSRMDSGAMDVTAGNVGLREIINSVAREFSGHPLSKESRIDISRLPQELTAVCDPERTMQLVRILIDNALKYSPPEELVMVDGKGDGNGGVCFHVRDKGSGIPPEELSRVFERFYRGRGAGRVRGTGLGLSIARELARLMNGTIEVESSDGGTVFSVTLPAGVYDAQTRTGGEAGSAQAV
jgi:two-component system sensor histidine kinase ResE